MTAVVSIATHSHLPRIRALMASVARFHPQLDRCVVVADGQPGRDYDLGDCRVILASDLIPDEAELRCRAFIYDAMEFCCSLKPAAMLTLLQDHEHVVYLDADTLLLAPLPDFVFDAGTAIALTPERLHPAPLDGLQPDEGRLKTYGMFNMGFAAVSRAGTGMLTWWEERLHRHGYTELTTNAFADQRWMDLAGLYFDVSIVRHAGINVGKWNVDERPLRPGPGISGLRAGEFELVLIHHSGVPPAWGTSNLPLYLQRPGARAQADPETMAIMEQLGQQYRELLSRHRNSQNEPYRWGYFPNGRPIPRATRRRYRQALIAAELAHEPPPRMPTSALPGAHRLDRLDDMMLLESIRTGWRIDRQRLAGKLLAHRGMG